MGSADTDRAKTAVSGDYCRPHAALPRFLRVGHAELRMVC
jgi:hypothetical protein